MNNFRSNVVNASYYDQNKLGYSSVSRNYGYGYRNQGVEQHQLGQLEYMLQNQRKKFREAKEKAESDLDNERKLRIQFQNKLIKLKDQFSRKEVTLSEMEFKVSNLLHQNQDIISENQRLRAELMRMEEVFGGKVHELEAQLAMQTRNFDDVTNQYNSEFEKFKKEGQDYIQQITFDFERKIKNLDEKVKQSQIIKRDLTLQNKKLNDIIISNKLNFDEQIRQIKNRSREDDLKKHQQISRSHQQKVKVMEEGKQVLVRKNLELQRILQQKERVIQEIQVQRNEETDRLRQDCSDQQQQLNHLNYIVGKLKSQLAEKDSMIGRSHNESDHELTTLKQQLQIKKQQNGQLAATIRDVRMTLKESEGEWERKRRQLVERCSFLESDARKYKDEYQRICDVLKSRINETINHVSFKK